MQHFRFERAWPPHTGCELTDLGHLGYVAADFSATPHHVQHTSLNCSHPQSIPSRNPRFDARFDAPSNTQLTTITPPSQIDCLLKFRFKHVGYGHTRGPRPFKCPHPKCGWTFRDRNMKYQRLTDTSYAHAQQGRGWLSDTAGSKSAIADVASPTSMILALQEQFVSRVR